MVERSLGVIRPSSSITPEDLPLVSSYGRIRNTRGFVSWGSRMPSGYRKTRVGGTTKLVHRLIARAFLGPPPTEHHCQVHHRDGIPWNNCASNLEYVTPSQNVSYSYSRPGRNTGSAAVSRPVEGRRRGTSTWLEYPSISEAAKRLGLNPEGVGQCCRGRQRRTGDFEFRFSAAHASDIPGERWRQAVHPDTGADLSTWAVSSFGRVKNTRGNVGWGSKTVNGYRSIGASLNGVTQFCLVHRLVAARFLKPVPLFGDIEVNHKDGDKANNHVDNLECVTRAQNMRHFYDSRSGREQVRRGSSPRPVLVCQRLGNEWAWYPSQSEASRRTGVSQNSISRCCHGEVQQVRGQRFRFAPATEEVLSGEE